MRWIILLTAVALSGCSLVFSGDDLRGDGGVTDAAFDAGFDSGLRDASPQDAGPTDAGADSGPPTDAGPTDAGPTDAGPTDAGPTDAGPTDAGPTDAGPTDGSTDAGPTDAGPDAGSCRVVSGLDGIRFDRSASLDVGTLSPRTLSATIVRTASVIDAPRFAFGLHRSGSFELGVGSVGTVVPDSITSVSGGGDCDSLQAAHSALAPGAAGVVRLVLAEASSSGDRLLMQDARVNTLAPLAPIYGDCVETTGSRVDTTGAAVLVNEMGETVAAAGGTVQADTLPMASPCLAVGVDHCNNGGTLDGAEGVTGPIGVGGLLFGARGDTVVYRSVVPMSAHATLGSTTRPIVGRLAVGINDDDRGVLVAPVGMGEVDVFQFGCTTERCTGVSGDTPVRTTFALPYVEGRDPRLSMARLEGDLYILAFIGPGGLELYALETSSTPTLSRIDGTPFGRTVYDVQVVASNGFVVGLVLAQTPSGGTLPGETLIQFQYRSCML